MDIQLNFWFYWFTFCGIILSAYFLAASGVYWLLYLRSRSLRSILLGHASTLSPSLQTGCSSTIIADIQRSVVSVIFFALGAAIFMNCYNSGVTQIYLDYALKDSAYLFLSYVMVLVLQDTFFYFTHRLFHFPLLFKWIHQGHHLSKPPTPWTFFALEPFEAMSQAFFLLVITLVIPLHMGVLFAVLVTMTVWSIGNHLGFQVVPVSQLSRWWGRWCIGSTHHLVHHQRYNRHFGLYFTFWDKMLNTQDSSYDAKLY